MKATPAGARAILDFWFGTPGSPEHDRSRAVWFKADAAFDAELCERFLDDHERAHNGRLDHWRLNRESCLALLLLLDQLPRNLFRGTARAFAGDAAARAVARHGLARGFDRDMPPVRRWFFYLPFEHSEHLGDQGLSLRLHATLPDDGDKASAMDWAQRHYDIIARFGRFPHRNGALRRVSTPEEEAFLCA
ncbi:MAG TPA: DUF924 family protein, partial [Stellaceae bacterium]|nr:DUF924 family protein [Stellaceae bacterium]